MHANDYEYLFDKEQIKKRIKYAVNNNVNTCVITGSGEPLQNRDFLHNLTYVFDELGHPFPNVELQTTGVSLMNKTKNTFQNIELLKQLGVNTISLSVSDIFSDENNMSIIGTPEYSKFKLMELCEFVKSQKFNLRISLNTINVYDNIAPANLFIELKKFNPDQVTFRKLWHSGDLRQEQTAWVKDNACKEETINNIHEYVGSSGKALYRLPFGAMVYSVFGMSVVIDDNCMNKDEIEMMKYVILREDGRLYCQWDDAGSLIF